MQAFEESRPLVDVALDDKDIMSHMSEEEVRDHLEPGCVNNLLIVEKNGPPF